MRAYVLVLLVLVFVVGCSGDSEDAKIGQAPGIGIINQHENCFQCGYWEYFMTYYGQDSTWHPIPCEYFYVETLTVVEVYIEIHDKRYEVCVERRRIFDCERKGLLKELMSVEEEEINRKD